MMILNRSLVILSNSLRGRRSMLSILGLDFANPGETAIRKMHITTSPRFNNCHSNEHSSSLIEDEASL